MREHFIPLIEVLKKFLIAGLKIHLTKSQFLKKESLYLGHLVSQAGLRPDLEEMVKVQERNPPANVRGVPA